jgi:sugar phosphate isomerase/epimerase
LIVGEDRKDIWPGVEFELFRRAKRERVGVHNPGLGHWQIFLCPEESYREIVARVLGGGSEDGDGARARPGLSLHHPFIAPFEGHERRESSQFLDADRDLRELSFRWLGDSLEKAGELGAEFVVTHLNHGEGVEDRAAALGLARAALRRFAEMAALAGVDVQVEFLGYHPALHEPGDFAEVLAELPRVQLCLDSGHLHRWGQIHGRDPYAAAELLAPLAASLHLWNVSSAEEYREKGHVPVHPEQRVEDGYVDVAWIVRTVLAVNPAATVIFEPSVPEGMTAEFIAAGMAWVGGIVAAARAGA